MLKIMSPIHWGIHFTLTQIKTSYLFMNIILTNKAALKHMDGFNQFAEDFFGALDIIKVDMFGPCNEINEVYF